MKNTKQFWFHRTKNFSRALSQCANCLPMIEDIDYLRYLLNIKLNNHGNCEVPNISACILNWKCVKWMWSMVSLPLFCRMTRTLVGSSSWNRYDNWRSRDCASCYTTFCTRRSSTGRVYRSLTTWRPSSSHCIRWVCSIKQCLDAPFTRWEGHVASC